MLKKSYHEDPDIEFYKQLNEQFRLTTVQVFYRLPDFNSILNEFVWQTLDCPPHYPRIYKFLNFWESNIEAPIHSIKIANVEIISPANFESVAEYYKIK